MLRNQVLNYCSLANVVCISGTQHSAILINYLLFKCIQNPTLNWQFKVLSLFYQIILAQNEFSFQFIYIYYSSFLNVSLKYRFKVTLSISSNNNTILFHNFFDNFYFITSIIQDYCSEVNKINCQITFQEKFQQCYYGAESLRIKKSDAGQYIQIESNETNLLIYRKPIKINDKVYQKQLKLKKGNSDYSTTYLELQIKKKITYLYEHLFNAFIIITISSFILLFIDIIVTYMLNLLNPIRVTTFLLIICFLIIQFTRYFLLMRVNNWRLAGFIILTMFMYNMIVVQFTQIYHQLYFQKNPFLYCERVSKLGEYLILTLTILLIFTIIENQTHFNGYVLLGIFSFYTIVNIFEMVFLVVALRQKQIKISPYDFQDESQSLIRIQ